MNQILLVTTNSGKLEEFLHLTENFPIFRNVRILSLRDMKNQIEVDENYPTFYENAYQKAKTYAEFYKMPVIADDSGLVVPALKGKPGVHSARYAGENASDEQNLELLLWNMESIKNREAYFECTVVFFVNAKQLLSATGRCYGSILRESRGRNGFGYDPVFYLPDYGRTLAELSLEEKNGISHRRKAFEKLIEKMTERNYL